MLELRKTVCNRDCPDVCGIVATVDTSGGTERVVKIGGDPDHPVTQGFLCYRTNHYLDTQYAPDRLLQPLYRARLDEEFRPISWDAALDLAAARLDAIRKESGPAAIFHYRSGGSLGLLKHLNDHFFELLGPCTEKRGDICSGAGDFAQMTDFGDEDSNDLFDLYNAKNILIWGKNVHVSSPHTIPVLREARARGAELVLIDPVHHRTASLCQTYVQPRPGGDLALALAVARVMFARGWVDSEAAARCDHVGAFRALCERQTVDEWCADADVTPAEAADLARRLGAGKPTAILVGWGMGRRVNGAAIVRALDALCALSGNLGIPGGGVSFYFKRRGAFDVSFIGRTASPRVIVEPLFGEQVLAATDPPIRAVWITAGNPVVMLPQSETVAEALATREFVAVVDPFLTDTARLAHLVLPTTSLLEADDVVGAYGHHWLGSARPVVAPPPGVLSDLEIAQGLATRLGFGAALAGTAREWKERLMAPRLGPHGITVDTLEAAPTKNPLPGALFADGKLKTASGRVNLLHEVDTTLPAAGGDFPLYLFSLSTDKSQSSQWAKAPVGEAIVTVHPSSAGGIPDGGLARLESAIGALTVRVRHDAKQRRDVALTTKGGHRSAGRCMNSLIRARLTDGGEGGALYDERVRLVPV